MTTPKTTIELRDINQQNWQDCIALKVADDQSRFVASNLFSLVESCYENGLFPLAIYAGDEMVGFLMWGLEPQGSHNRYWIVRLMVGRAHQGKGYGRAAMRMIIDRLRADPGCRAIDVSFVPDNAAAEQLYASLGFERTGEIVADEVVMRLALRDAGEPGSQP